MRTAFRVANVRSPILSRGKLTRGGCDFSMKDCLCAIGQNDDRVTVELRRNSLWVKVELVGQPSLVAPATAESGEVPGLALAAPGSALGASALVSSATESRVSSRRSSRVGTRCSKASRSEVSWASWLDWACS